MLTEVEVRVLAALIEKEAAVPESYPLTLNALRLACNQTTNRRPVVDYDDRTVVDAVQSLKSRRARPLRASVAWRTDHPLSPLRRRELAGVGR